MPSLYNDMPALGSDEDMPALLSASSGGSDLEQGAEEEKVLIGVDGRRAQRSHLPASSNPHCVYAALLLLPSPQGGEWACPECTFENQSRRRRCVMCAKPRPPHGAAVTSQRAGAPPAPRMLYGVVPTAAGPHGTLPIQHLRRASY